MAVSRTVKRNTASGQNKIQSPARAGTKLKTQDPVAEVQKELVRSVSPSRLNQLWRSLEKNQDISYSYDEDEELDFLDAKNDEENLDDEEIMDSEVSMADEEDLEDFDDDAHEDYNPDVFFLNVAMDENGNAHCTAPTLDTYLSATPRSPLGDNCLFELSNRGETLKKLAKWLEENRQAFLKFRNTADLGENAWEECAHGKIPVNQEKCQGKSLADILGVPGSTFGKHIRNVMLKWEGIMVSLEILFCKEAHEAWAVSAYKGNPGMSAEDLDVLAQISGVKSETIQAMAK